MVMLKPFRGVRPRPELVEAIASPPYDVVDTATAKRMAEGSPLSYLHVVRAEIDLPEGTDLYDPAVYAKAGENLHAMIQRGEFIRDETPSLYLYRQTMDGRSQLGIVGLVSAEEYGSGLIKIHEKTLKRKEDDRVNYILGTHAHNEPVFLSFRSQAEMKTLLHNAVQGEPTYAFTTDDQFGHVRHEFFVVSDPEVIQAVVSGFDRLPCLYVADGHHRTASAWRVWKKFKEENPNHTGAEPYNDFLAIIFPHDELFIYDYNRLIRDIGSLTTEEFLKRIEEKFTVESPFPQRKPERRHTFGLYIDGAWHRISARPGTFDEGHPQRRLDVAILHENLIAPILGITDPKTDPRIHFVGGILGMEALEEAVDSGEYRLAFSLFPTRLEDVFNVADAELTMPPKSTWFEPKLRSGLIIHPL